MTKAPEFTGIAVELTDEEADAIAAKAKTIGLDLETYLRVRALTGFDLPEPAAFFALFRRLTTFAQQYEACIQAMAAHQNAKNRLDVLVKLFPQLLQEWDRLYGPRPAE